MRNRLAFSIFVWIAASMLTAIDLFLRTIHIDVEANMAVALWILLLIGGMTALLAWKATQRSVFTLLFSVSVFYFVLSLRGINFNAQTYEISKTWAGISISSETLPDMEASQYCYTQTLLSIDLFGKDQADTKTYFRGLWPALIQAKFPLPECR